MLGRMQEQWNISYRLPAVRNAEGGIIGDAVRGSTVAVAGGNAGTASLAARAAGADVTHLDSVRQVVTWARHNMEISSAALPESSSSAMTSAASCPSASAPAWSGSRCWSVGLFVRYCLYG